MIFLIGLLASLAGGLELIWRARPVDEHGNLHPSLREQAMAERYCRAVDRHAQIRREYPR